MRAAHRPRAARRGWRGGAGGTARRRDGREGRGCPRACLPALSRSRSQKGWAAEALVYNELAQEWTQLEDQAARLANPGNARPVRSDCAMNTEKETLQRVQGALYHLRRGLAPFVEARMKARHGAQWLAYASRAAGGDPRGALDEYGLLEDHDRQLARRIRRELPARRKAPGAQFRLDRAGGAQRDLASVDPAQDDEALRYLDAIAPAVARGQGARGGDRRGEAPLRRAAAERPYCTGSGSCTGRRPSARAGAGDRQAGQGAAAVDRGGAAAPGCARQPLQGGGVRRRSVRGRFRQRRGRLRDAAGLFRHHLSDRRAEARPYVRPCSGFRARAAIR